jgi:hypothetical protein
MPQFLFYLKFYYSIILSRILGKNLYSIATGYKHSENYSFKRITIGQTDLKECEIVKIEKPDQVHIDDNSVSLIL